MSDNDLNVPNDGAAGTTDTVPNAASDNDAVPPSHDPAELIERFRGWYVGSRDHRSDWRSEASECYDFVAGRQWDEESLQVLNDQNRPALTFDQLGPFIDAVAGMEINGRQETTFAPRQVGASGETDLLTEAGKWVRDETSAEDEESEAFKDVLICGEGWIQTRLDYDQEPDGKIIMDRVDPMEIYPDPASQKQNYADGRYVMRAKDVPLDMAQQMFPDKHEYDLHALWAEDTADEADSPHNARLAPYYRIDQADDIDRDKQMVRLVEVEWYEMEPAYRVLDPTTNRWVRLDEDRMTILTAAARAGGFPVKSIKDQRRKYYKAIVGAEVLRFMDGAEQGGFSYKAITGKRDRNKRQWYGMIRALRDPQRWANKFFSQALHIMNTNAKGGLIAEADAFEDIEEARDNWADPDSITVLAPGGIGKVQPKNPPVFPQQLNEMLQYALASIPKVAGVNVEALGQSTSAGANVAMVEEGRRQQVMNVLAGFFNAKRRYQKDQGKLMLWLIQTFIADGRLIRIGGAANAKYVPLIHQPGTAEYDVIVDEAPTSTNQKQRVWGGLMQLSPMLRGLPIPPQFWISALKYSPFPESFVEEATKIMSQPHPPNPDAQSKAALDQATAQLRGAQAQKLQAEAQIMPVQMNLEAQNTAAAIDLKRAQATNQYQNAGLSTAQAIQDSNDAAHQRDMDLARLGLDAHAQGHDQVMAHIQHAADQAQPPMPDAGQPPGPPQP